MDSLGWQRGINATPHFVYEQCSCKRFFPDPTRPVGGKGLLFLHGWRDGVCLTLPEPILYAPKPEWVSDRFNCGHWIDRRVGGRPGLDPLERPKPPPAAPAANFPGFNGHRDYPVKPAAPVPVVELLLCGARPGGGGIVAVVGCAGVEGDPGLECGLWQRARLGLLWLGDHRARYRLVKRTRRHPGRFFWLRRCHVRRGAAACPGDLLSLI